MGLFNPPPTNGGSPYPDIPVPQFQPAGQQLAQGATSGGFWDDLVNKFRKSVPDAISFIINYLAGELDTVFAYFLQFVSAAQGIGQPGFLKLMSAVLSDLLGLEFDPNELQSALAKGGRLSSLRVAGENLYNVLQTEFSPGGSAAGLGPSPVPAYGFLGFLIEFSIRQGNVATFCELIPEEFNFFAGLREYGEMLAKSLGLGRMARRALQPLVQTLVADPLQWYLNAAYRPKLLAEAQYVKALNRGDLTRDQVDTWLSWMGYSEQGIDILIADTARPWSAHELLELARLGAMDDQTAISLLQQAGIDQGTATQMWTAAKGAATSGLNRQYITQVVSRYHNGLTTWQSARDAITAAPLLQEEKLLYYAIVGDQGANYWRHLSESELERAYLGGIIDMTTIQTAWQNLGYSPDAVQTLTLLLLLKQSTGNKTKAGHVAHKALTEAQLEKAYKGGIIDLAQIQAGWTNLGYSAADQEVLTALVTAATPAPGATTLPGLTTP